jgi:hypothetical protein
MRKKALTILHSYAKMIVLGACAVLHVQSLYRLKNAHGCSGGNMALIRRKYAEPKRS